MLISYTHSDWGFVRSCYLDFCEELGIKKNDTSLEEVKNLLISDSIKIIKNNGTRIGIASYVNTNGNCMFNLLFILKKHRNTKSILMLKSNIDKLCDKIILLTKKEHSNMYNFVKNHNATIDGSIRHNGYYKYIIENKKTKKESQWH